MNVYFFYHLHFDHCQAMSGHCTVSAEVILVLASTKRKMACRNESKLTYSYYGVIKISFPCNDEAAFRNNRTACAHTLRLPVVMGRIQDCVSLHLLKGQQ